MANISDIIETFLLDTLGEDNSLNISRNELASYFSVAPSQINYVLSTRFTPARGYSIQSRRGGGGFITVVRLNEPKSELVEQIMSRPIAQGYSYPTACHILDRLCSEGLFTQNEVLLLKATLSDKTLIVPTLMQKDAIRASILKSAVAQALQK